MNFEQVKAEAQRLGPLASFASMGFDGTPHVVPLMPAWLEDQLVFGARRTSLKVRHVRRHSAAAMQFLTFAEAFPDALLLKGTASIVEEDDDKRRLWDSGSFPFLSQMYQGPTDPELCFVRFAPDRASLIREGGLGQPSSWRSGD